MAEYAEPRLHEEPGKVFVFTALHLFNLFPKGFKSLRQSLTRASGSDKPEDPHARTEKLLRGSSMDTRVQRQRHGGSHGEQVWQVWPQIGSLP